MLIINEIDFTQRRIIGLETDEKLLEVSLTKTKLKIVFNLEKIITIKKKKNKEKIVDIFVHEEDEIIEVEVKEEEPKEEIKEDEPKEEVKEEVIEEVKPQRKKIVSKAETDKEEYETLFRIWCFTIK